MSTSKALACTVAHLTQGAWHLYLLECRNGAMYAGIARDVLVRFAEHRDGKGARYTRSNPPVRIIGTAPFPDRSAALKAEYAIKQIPRGKKVAFLEVMAGAAA